jgi:hypothetical protein
MLQTGKDGNNDRGGRPDAAQAAMTKTMMVMAGCCRGRVGTAPTAMTAKKVTATTAWCCRSGDGDGDNQVLHFHFPETLLKQGNVWERDYLHLRLQIPSSTSSPPSTITFWGFNVFSGNTVAVSADILFFIQHCEFNYRT